MSEEWTPYKTKTVVKLDDTYEAILKLNVRRYQDLLNLRRSESERSTNGAKSAPFRSGRLNQTERRKSAPFAPGNGANNVPFGFQQSPSGPKRSDPEEQKVKLKLALDELREWISDTANIMAGYDQLLAPVWGQENAIKDAIGRTHDRGESGRLKFCPGEAQRRKPMFDALLDIAVQWGPTKNARREVDRRLRGYEREAKGIRLELAAIAKKEGKGKRHG
jgi:hypothetical protein